MSVTIVIIVLCVGASLLAWNDPTLMYKWTFSPYLVRTRNEYHRFLTSGFIHGDYVHLLFNLITLYSFGSFLEMYFTAYVFGGLGPIMFVALYLISMIAADVPTYFKYNKAPHYRSIGASGAVSGVLFASILIHPLMPINMFFIPINIPGFVFGFLYLIYTNYQAKRGGDNINHDAHFYGAIAGMVFTIIVYPTSIEMFFLSIMSWKGF